MYRQNRPLPVIEVEEPCPASWDHMNGDERTRFCSHCQRHVHDLSAMRQADIEDLICRSAGRLCVRFERGPDGRVKTLDYNAPRRGRGWTRRWIVGGVIASTFAACANVFWHYPRPTMTTGVMVTVGRTRPPPKVMGAAAPSAPARDDGAECIDFE